MDPSSAINKTTPTEVSLKSGKKATIVKYSDLDERTQYVARETIGKINRQISTNGGVSNWEECGYTHQICERLYSCKNAKNTLFIAFDNERPIGYVAFYTKSDKIPYANQFLKNDKQAYCSWTGVDEEYKGNGLAEHLKLQIFEPEHGVTKFKGHIKKTNGASIRVLDKFTEKGYKTTKEEVGHQYLYSVKKSRG